MLRSQTKGWKNSSQFQIKKKSKFQKFWKNSFSNPYQKITASDNAANLVELDRIDSDLLSQELGVFNAASASSEKFHRTGILGSRFYSISNEVQGFHQILIFKHDEMESRQNFVSFCFMVNNYSDYEQL